MVLLPYMNALWALMAQHAASVSHSKHSSQQQPHIE